MKELELKQTAIPNEMTLNLMEHYDFKWVANMVPDLYRTVFFTIAEILKHYKSKNENPRVGFILKDLKGNFKIGAIMNYHAPEDGADSEDDKGNYTLEFTLNEKDMTDVYVPADSQSDLFITCATNKANEVMGGRFKTFEFCNNLFCESIDTLATYLDKNAIAEDELSVVFRGVFVATVGCKKDKKTFTIVPGEMVKQIIKGDINL